MGIRLHVRGSPEISGGQALARVIGVGLCFMTLGLGFLPILFTKRRRGLDDWMAGTEVVYSLSAARVAPWAELPEEDEVTAEDEAPAVA